MPAGHFVDVVSRMTATLVGIAGGIFTLVMVYGGIRLMVAHTPRTVQASKELMGRAAIGLLLILLVGAIRQLLQYVAS